jgi:nickel-type superoxide dismutase maturation protease
MGLLSHALVILIGQYPGGREVPRPALSGMILPVWRTRLRAVVVRGDSMNPGLRAGDCLIVRVGASIRTGDVVVARHPLLPDLLLVKRAARRDDGGWWLLSDNAEAGRDDSRAFGAVPDDAVIGRVLVRYYPGRPRLIRRRAAGRG